MEKESVAVLVQVGKNPVNPTGIEAARAALDAMYLVALPEKKLRQIRSILSSNSGNQRTFHKVKKRVSG
jgi:hypothetical protein